MSPTHNCAARPQGPPCPFLWSSCHPRASFTPRRHDSRSAVVLCTRSRPVPESGRAPPANAQQRDRSCRFVLRGRTLPVMVMRTRISAELNGLRAAARAGMIGPMPPRALAAAARAMRRYGPLGAATALPAHRFPGRPGLADERGTLTFGELDRRCNALANALLSRGIGPGDTVGILCRNHRGLLEAMSGAAKTGASVLFLNTDFAAPQLRDAAAREGVTAVVHDEEFAGVVDGLDVPRFSDADLEVLIARADDAPPPAPARHGSMVILTSGTSGRPKGAPRRQPRSLALPGGILSKVPFRAGEPMFVGPPLFHGLGLTSAILALGLGSTLVLRRRFDAALVLDDLERHRCTSFVAVPVMLSRLLAVPGVEERDLSR